uniref:Flagellar biosynthesis protein FliS n=1 Tax=uncultured bacterium contig00049 TaxID=1181534 RepID=A0A806JYT9_9BACT|nr:flagellar biosynthesis protein FliS [uncultured bacterium contig00049]
MLYDEAIRQLNLALEMLDLKNQDAKIHEKIEPIGKAIMKAEEIITELMVSLDFDQGGDIAKNLFSLYSWFNRELMEANITQDMGRIKTVRDMFSELRDCWSQIAGKSTAEHSNREAVGLNIAG